MEGAEGNWARLPLVMKEGKSLDQAQTGQTGPDAELLCNDLSSQREVSMFPVGCKDFLSHM